MFSVWKAELIKLESTGDVEKSNLLNYIKEASAAVKSEVKAKGWCDHVTKYLIRCAGGEPLDENYNANTLASLT